MVFADRLPLYVFRASVFVDWWLFAGAMDTKTCKRPTFIESEEMENITLQSMLNEFSQKNSFTEKDSLRFEKFVSHSLLANEYYDSYDHEQVSTGDCVGIDAVAISINDVLVYSEIAAKNHTVGQFEVCFNFIQAKTSPSLDLGDYLKFLQTISVFFSGTENQQPEELKEAFRIKTHIYEKASRFRSYPNLLINYVYTGRGVIEDPTFKNQIDAFVASIRQMPYLFSTVISNLVGANDLADRYKEALNRITKHLIFQRHVALPKLSSATAAYLGVAKCLDYIETLKNHDGQINKGSFYDNVRDYLGATNPVNADIENTIKSESQRNLFSVLNNGVTLVAKKVVPSGDRFEISGFQVVNGCQTSHVLFNNRKYVTDDMYITVKLIETDDVDLSSSVIKATNSQSLVMKEAFATIKPYHKRLEDFFNAMNAVGHRFYYERRPHQFDDNDDISSSEIVSAPLLIKSFVSVVIEEPHKVHFYYGQILRDYNNEKNTLLFEENHHPGLYFISHLIAVRSREFAVRHKLGLWSYHIALLIKKRIGIKLNISDKLTDAKVLEMISKIEKGFPSAANDVISLVSDTKFNKNDVMLPEVTKSLLDQYSKRFLQTNSASPVVETANLIKLKNGSYFVRKLRVIDGGIGFSYGSNKYLLPCHENFVLQNDLETAKIFVTDGRIISISN